MIAAAMWTDVVPLLDHGLQTSNVTLALAPWLRLDKPNWGIEWNTSDLQSSLRRLLCLS
jgi:hypothetical protein